MKKCVGMFGRMSDRSEQKQSSLNNKARNALLIKKKKKKMHKTLGCLSGITFIMINGTNKWA